LHGKGDETGRISPPRLILAAIGLVTVAISSDAVVTIFQLSMRAICETLHVVHPETADLPDTAHADCTNHTTPLLSCGPSLDDTRPAYSNMKQQPPSKRCEHGQTRKFLIRVNKMTTELNSSVFTSPSFGVPPPCTP